MPAAVSSGVTDEPAGPADWHSGFDCVSASTAQQAAGQEAMHNNSRKVGASVAAAARNAPSGSTAMLTGLQRRQLSQAFEASVEFGNPSTTDTFPQKPALDERSTGCLEDS